jgi:hypothetical protein
MAFNAKLYDEINRPQTNDANELIETIIYWKKIRMSNESLLKTFFNYNYY